MTINDIKHQKGFSSIQINRNRNQSNKMDFILTKTRNDINRNKGRNQDDYLLCVAFYAF